MNWRNAFCCISHARVNNIVCHNKKVWNFDGVSGALSLCVWVVTCPDLHHIVPVRRGGNPDGGLVQGTDGNLCKMSLN